MRILLVRHGRPDFDDQTVVRGAQVSLNVKKYLDATVNEAASSDPLCSCRSDRIKVLSSTLPRAISSAKLLGFSDIERSGLLNESELPRPDSLVVPLPWRLFIVLFRIAWLLGYSKNAPGRRADIARAREGAEHIRSCVGVGHTVVVVGHGVMNRLIARSLTSQGWAIDEKTGSGYWSVISLSPTAV